MTADSSLDLVRAYWTAQLGFDPDLANGVLVARPEGTLRGYHGVYVFRHGFSCIVSPPAAWRAPLRAALAGRTPDGAFDVDTLLAVLGAAAERAVGPSWIGCADASDLRPVRAGAARQLEGRDRPALLALAEACGAADWEHSAIDPARPPIFGAFEGPALAAAASYEPWGERLRAVGVVTHPARRRRGYGRAVAAAATAHGIEDGRVMLWQTLEANAPSMAIARALGYQPYARTIAVRLRGGG
ncbi:MAG: GNAT family N-acetyltransferase [Chloroflexota bacterium]|nr:GNAT family N-acetyltransferase [Chloroflexota bacterium]